MIRHGEYDDDAAVGAADFGDDEHAGTAHRRRDTQDRGHRNSLMMMQRCCCCCFLQKVDCFQDEKIQKKTSCDSYPNQFDHSIEL